MFNGGISLTVYRLSVCGVRTELCGAMCVRFGLFGSLCLGSYCAIRVPLAAIITGSKTHTRYKSKRPEPCDRVWYVPTNHSKWNPTLGANIGHKDTPEQLTQDIMDRWSR